ncbi:MAG TPA: ligand-binding protein SH3 [Firmicutes bacterium]|nr:ligand-binding protein SH3 [Bacillota bacterium]HBT16880.1 ligand-binding protein SH3 [Bacillota bacterium]
MQQMLKIILMAIVPYIELRGAIPLAILGYGASPLTAFVLGVCGNLLPIIPIMLLLPVLANWAERILVIRRFFCWIRRRTKKHRVKINNYGFFGLVFFVAIPLPMTGVWTGSAIAYLLGVRKRSAFAALTLGVLIAGVIVTLMVILGSSFNNILD